MSSLLARSVGVSLHRLFSGDAQVVGSQDIYATSCTSNFRQVRPGDVFVALTEADADGHDVAAEAIRRGASAVIGERLMPVFGVPQFVVADSRTAYGRLCQALMGNPAKQLKVIGVTGTSGKTTVARLMASIFREARGDAGAIDSIGYDDGCDRRDCNAELSSPALARSLAHMVADGRSHAIVELSSRQLSRSVLAGVELDAACLTHVGRDHLDWHGTLHNYQRAKRRIIDHLATTGVAILNADDPESVRILSELDHPALTIGLRQPAEIAAEIIEQHVNEQTFVLTAGDESVGVRTTIIGEHHVYNCLMAAALGLVYRIDLTTVARGLEAVQQLPGRMERIVCGQEFAVLVDAAQTPDTLRACLRAARQVTDGRVLCVFGAAQEQGNDCLALGRVAGTMADLAIVTGSGGRGRNPLQCSADVLRGAADVGTAKGIVDRAAAIAWALDEARAGDTVVIAGMGNRVYDEPDSDGMPVGDRETVQQVLYGTFSRRVPFRVVA